MLSPAFAEPQPGRPSGMLGTPQCRAARAVGLVPIPGASSTGSWRPRNEPTTKLVAGLPWGTSPSPLPSEKQPEAGPALAKPLHATLK